MNQMINLIINTDEILIPGKIYNGPISDENYIYRQQAIKCIRKSTLKEYLNFVKKCNLSHLVKEGIIDTNFYLVEILD